MVEDARKVLTSFVERNVEDMMDIRQHVIIQQKGGLCGQS
jgi:hypothetical protein